MKQTTNADERKMIVHKLKHWLNEANESEDSEEKKRMEICYEMFAFILAHRDFVYSYSAFYNTIINKLHEFISLSLTPEFTAFCVDTLRNLFNNNTAPNHLLRSELRTRCMEICNRSESMQSSDLTLNAF